jgi:hypothetical protein
MILTDLDTVKVNKWDDQVRVHACKVLLHLISSEPFGIFPKINNMRSTATK